MATSPTHLTPSPIAGQHSSRRRRSTGLSNSTSRPRTSFSTSQAGSWDEVSVSGVSGDGDEQGTEEWEAESPDRGSHGPGREEKDTARRKREEKGEMKPLTVVLYMLALYAIFGILTRSDELEIMPHLPSGSHSQFASSARSEPHHSYQIPYHLPHLPSPHIPDGTQVSTFRYILGLTIYPFYLAITLLTIPVPMILNVLHLAWQILRVVLSPVTGSAKIMLRFVALPFGLLKGIVDALYPVWVLLGGTIGAGCVLGGTAGWAGSWVLEKLSGRRSRRQAERDRERDQEKRDKTRRRKQVRRRSSRQNPTSADPIDTRDSATATQLLQRHASARGRTLSPSSGEDLLVQTPEPVMVSVLVSSLEERNKMAHRRSEGLDRVRDWENALVTGRKDVALGTRRRGHQLSADD